MRLHELVGTYNSLVEELKNKKDLLTSEEITNKLNDIKNLEEEIKILEETEKLEVKNFMTNATVHENKEEKRVYNSKVFNALLRGTATEEEKRVYNDTAKGQLEKTDSKGGYLVPEQQLKELYEYKRTLNDLAELVTKVEVTSPKGSMPSEVINNNKLANLTEGEELTLTEEDFAQIKWAISDYGDLMGVSTQLYNDASIDILGYLKGRIAKKSVRTHNAKIIEILKGLSNTTGTKTTGISALDEAIITKLDPVYREKNGVLITNQTGRLYLEQQTDKNGLPLLTESYSEPGFKIFRGLKVVEVPDSVLEVESTNVCSFFVGNLEALITHFYINGLELSVSTEAGFTKNMIYIKAIERFQFVKVDENAMAHVKITVK